MMNIIDELMRMFSGKSYRGKKRLRNMEYLDHDKDDHFIDESVILIDKIQFSAKGCNPVINKKRFIKFRRMSK